MTQKKKKAGQTGIEPNQELRTQRFEIRLSPTEAERLMARALLAQENSIAQYARNKLLYEGHEATQQLRQQREVSKAVVAELARIGNNVNQIARALNGDDELSIAMLEALCQVETRLATLDQHHRQASTSQVQP